jgi:hypothetical protein
MIDKVEFERNYFRDSDIENKHKDSSILQSSTAKNLVNKMKRKLTSN